MTVFLFNSKIIQFLKCFFLKKIQNSLEHRLKMKKKEFLDNILWELKRVQPFDVVFKSKMHKKWFSSFHRSIFFSNYVLRIHIKFHQKKKYPKNIRKLRATKNEFRRIPWQTLCLYREQFCVIDNDKLCLIDSVAKTLLWRCQVNISVGI